MKENYKRYKYKYPPIQEAIFEAKFSGVDIDSTLPGQFYEKVKHEFPEKNDLKVITITLGLANPNFQQNSPQSPTLQAWNRERTECLQIGPGIVAANILKYRSWEYFQPNISLLLNSYLKCTNPKNCERVGVRYMNRFLIPGNDVTISDYFCLNISLPELLLDTSAYDLTLIKNSIYHNSEIQTKIRFATDSLKPNEKGIAFLLDIDSSIMNDISMHMEKILESASVCHNYIAAIFESILQERTRALLGGISE